MGVTTNLTDLAVGHLAGRDREGRSQIVCLLKATFEWNEQGATRRVTPTTPVRAVDQYAGEPGVSGLIHAADLGPAKPRLDVLVEGAVLFPAPIEEADVTLEMGSRMRKTVKVFGDRIWYALPGSGVVPSRPKAAARVAIAWERSFGGRDPKDLTCVERRNPAGTGMCRDPASLVDHPAPSFEDPALPLKSWKDRPSPRGFGPIAPHWLPRSTLAGTFDQRWHSERRPLLPEDFDPAFFNVAPADQQLDRFIPGSLLLS